LGRCGLTFGVIPYVSANPQSSIKDEGKYRETNDIAVIDILTGEIFYTPPDFKLVPSLIEDLCYFINETPKEQFMHPIIKASIIHFLVGYIHPFIDGNGRTARALFYWFLISNGYWLIEYMSISRIIINSPTKYAQAYLRTETDENDLTYFLKYKLNTIEIALMELRKYITRKLKEKDEISFLLGHIDFNQRQRVIVKKFYENPKFTIAISEAKNRFGISYASARNDLSSLERDGWITKIGKRNIQYIKSIEFDKMIEKVKTQKRIN